MQNTPANTPTKEVTQAKQRFSIVGNAPALINALDRAIKVAPIDLTVLVTGESGSGKESFPKIIHNYSSRKHKKYIAVNCGAIPEGTIDSELFGHEKGSFTGAISSRKGYFEEADGGTLFLDEVAELPLTTQARLLRVLESGEFLKVGSSVVQKTNVRIVAATNVNLVEAVKKGKFREDLYYRLSTVMISVPSLHDRGDDVVLIARKFAADFSEKYMTPPITFSEEAKRAFLLYRWPGNVRQLKNIVEQLALFKAGAEVSREDVIDALPVDHSPLSSPVEMNHHDYESERDMLWQTLMSMRAEIRDLQDRINKKGSSLQDVEYEESPSVTSLIKYENLLDSEIKDCLRQPNEASSGRTLVDSEREAVAAALARHNGNKKLVAEELNISLRTLYRKIREFGLDQ